MQSHGVHVFYQQTNRRSVFVAELHCFVYRGTSLHYYLTTKHHFFGRYSLVGLERKMNGTLRTVKHVGNLLGRNNGPQ
jgi:hypothetical protein